MKRIRIELTRKNDQEMMIVTEPLFVAIVADRFIIEDNRGPIKKPLRKPKET